MGSTRDPESYSKAYMMEIGSTRGLWKLDLHNGYAVGFMPWVVEGSTLLARVAH